MKNSRLIAVLGMHRSGTSAITRGLQVFGVKLGERLQAPVEGINDKGYWEDIDLGALNIEMLSAIQSDWSFLAPVEPADVEVLLKKAYFLRAVELIRQKVGGSPVFGFKDPRVARLLPFWKEVFGYLSLDASYVLTLRHPLSVVKSLVKRDGFDAERSYLLWLSHVVTSLSGSAGARRVIVDYDCMMQEPDRELGRIAKCLDLQIDQAESQRYKAEFLDEGLRHTRYGLNDLQEDGACPPIVREIYAALLDVTSGKTPIDSAAMQSQMAGWFREFHRLKAPLKLIDRLFTQKADLKLNAAVAERDTAMAERDTAMAERNIAQAQRDMAVAERDTAMAERDTAMAELDAMASVLKDKKRQAEELRHKLETAGHGTQPNHQPEARRRVVVIFGAGEGGRRALRMADKSGWKTLCFLDNSPNAWDTAGPGGIPIKPPSILKSEGFMFDEIIVASKPGKAAIFAQLTSMGFKAHDDFVYFEGLESSFPDIDPQLISWLDAYSARQPADIGKPFSLPARTAPTVSIIITVHNQAGRAYRCLMSISQNQPRHRYEIIVVDDASTDATPGMLRSIGGVRVVRNESVQGRARSRNAAAKLANGAFIHFLDADTEVLPGWMDELVDTFNAFPGVGMAGGKVIGPDGVLKSAGGVLCDDGPALSCGRGEDPDRPEYSYLRQADCLSGASVMIRREAFAKLGGFDDNRQPDDGEEYGFALKVRGMGYKAFYQPMSRVIHHEDSAQAQHSRAVAGTAPGSKKGRSVTGRALFIDAVTPDPDQQGGSPATIGLMRIFRELGYKVTFIPQDRLLHMGDHTRNLQRVGVECVYVPYYTSVGNYLKEAGDIFDVAVVFGYAEFEKCAETIKKFCPTAKVIFELPGLHGDKEERRRQLETLRHADMTIVRAEADLETIRSGNPGLKAAYYPWAIDVRGRTASFAQRNGIAFIGDFQSQHNAAATLYFAREIFPAIRTGLPEVEFHIYGNKPPQEILGLDGNGVKVHGFVQPFCEWFRSHRVFVEPLLSGAGFKREIAHSMSYGLPCVLTSVAAEGMGLTDGLNCLIADTPRDFASAVTRLYTDIDLWNRLSDESARHARRLCSFDSGRAIISAIMKDIGASVDDQRTPGVSRKVYNTLGGIWDEDSEFAKPGVLSEKGIETLRFRCNICGEANEAAPDALTREDSSCAFCRSNVRFRSMIHVLSIGLFGRSLALDEFPDDRRIKGVGLSDWNGYASRLARKLDYTNTFYHMEPRLDINDIPPEMEGTLDFIISSDVFEHTPPPVSLPFHNAFRLLKPGGTLVLSVPFTHGEPEEYYPELHDYSIEDIDGKHRLVNTTKQGVRQVFEEPVFHGGGGLTLAMRMFTEKSLIGEMEKAGFSETAAIKKNCLPYGIYWQYNWGYSFMGKKRR
jgi:GT2 family glycosyltransferase/SAM-dependent methyltransferase